MRRILGIGMGIAAIAAATVGLNAPSASANESWQCDGSVIVGSAFRDVLQGTDCDDFIMGRLSNDVLIGHEGSDVLAGNSGNDVLLDASDFNEWGTVDTLRGGLGTDRCVGNEFDVFISCEFVIVR